MKPAPQRKRGWTRTNGYLDKITHSIWKNPQSAVAIDNPQSAVAIDNPQSQSTIRNPQSQSTVVNLQSSVVSALPTNLYDETRGGAQVVDQPEPHRVGASQAAGAELADAQRQR